MRLRPSMMQSFHGMVAATVILTAWGCGPTTKPVGLEPGSDVIRVLTPRELHVYPIQVPADSYVRFRFLPQGVDGRLRLRGPDGNILEDVDGPGGAYAEEVLVRRLPTAGAYRLEVSASEGRGEYELYWAELRPVEKTDPVRIDAWRTYHRARHLAELETASARDQALGLMEEALETFRSSGDHQALAEVLKGSGELLDLEDRQEEALVRFEEAFARSEDPKLKAALWNDRARMLLDLGRIDAALRAHRRSIEAWRELQVLDEIAAAEHSLGTTLYRLGRLQESRERLTEALDLRRRAGDVLGEGKTLATLGVVARNMGETEAARAYYEQALELVRESGSAQSELSILINLGFLHRARGDLQKALDTYGQALPLAEILGIVDSQRSLSSNLGIIHQDLGELDQARTYFERAVALARDSPQEEAKALVLLAGLHEDLGQPGVSLDMYRQALNKSPEEMSRTRADAYLGIGRSELLRGRPEAGSPAIEAALDLYRQRSFVFGEVVARLELGRCHRLLGQFAAAEGAWQHALEVSRRIGSAPLEAEAHLRLARLERDRDRLHRALDHVRASIDVRESLRSQVANAQLRATYLSRRQDAYDLQVDLLLRLHDRYPSRDWAEQALAASERRRARTLIELLEESRLKAATTPRRREVEALLDQLSWVQGRLLRALARRDSEPREVARLEAELKDRREALERAEWSLRHDPATQALLRDPPALTLAHARELLAPGMALVEYALGDERSVLFVVTSTEFQVFDLPPYDTIEPWINAAREGLRAPSRRSRGRLREASRRLHQNLILPAESILQSVDQLLVVPDRGLWWIPLETFLTDDQGTYLIERWSVAYAPSASALVNLDQRTTAARREPETLLVAFANPTLPASDPAPFAGASTVRGLVGRRQGGFSPLPAAEMEVRAIADLFAPSARDLYLGEAASERAVKDNPRVEAARFLHFATHGILNETRPAFSGLLLSISEPGNDDGWLQVHEVFDLSLSAELVVLSGCETGLGRQVRGEGLVGLSQAFLVAGAESLVVSLWSVEDGSTADLMVAFYRHLRSGASSMEALRRAKLEALAAEGRARPFHWAAFIMLGRS